MPHIRAEYSRYNMYGHNGELRFSHIDFAETQSARNVRLPMCAIEQADGTETLQQILGYKNIFIIIIIIIGN